MTEVKLELNYNGFLAETLNGRRIINDYECQLNYGKDQQFIGSNSQTILVGSVLNVNFNQTLGTTFKTSWNYFDIKQTFANQISYWGINQYQIAGGSDIKSNSKIQQKISVILYNTNKSIEKFKNDIDQQLNLNLETIENTTIAETSASTSNTPLELFGVGNTNSRKAILLNIFAISDSLVTDIKQSVGEIRQILNKNYYPGSSLLLANKGLTAEVFANPKIPDNSASAKLWMTPDTIFDKGMPAIYLIAQTPEYDKNEFNTINNTKSNLVIMPGEIMLTSTYHKPILLEDHRANIFVNGKTPEIIIGVQRDKAHNNYNLGTGNIRVNESGILGAGQVITMHTINIATSAASSAILKTNSIELSCAEFAKAPSGIQVSNNSVSIFKESDIIFQAQSNSYVTVNGNLIVKTGDLTHNTLSHYADNNKIFASSQEIHNRIRKSMEDIELRKNCFVNHDAAMKNYHSTAPIASSSSSM